MKFGIFVLLCDLLILPLYFNVLIYTTSNKLAIQADKSYFISAFCNESCHRNYRCMFVDYCNLLDELLVLSFRNDLDKNRKKLRYYARIQIFFIDDFAICRYSEDGIKILYHLIKTRTDLKTSTMFTSQYAPSEWGKCLSNEENCYG